MRLTYRYIGLWLLLAMLLTACGTRFQATPRPSFEGNAGLLTYNTGERDYYQYRLIEAEWSAKQSQLPKEWLEAAKAAVAARRGVEEPRFMRAWFADFSGDGELEAIVLLHGAEAASMEWFDGNANFVYLNSDGGAQYLCSGFEEDWESGRKLECWLVQYPNDRHILLRTGNQTAAGGSWMAVYSPEEGRLASLLESNWLEACPGGFFLESGGVQGQGPAFHFWDAAQNRYSTVGPVEITFGDFALAFEEAREHLGTEEQQAADVIGIAGSLGQIDRVEVYGGRFYHLLFTSQFEEEYGMRVVTWEHGLDGGWRFYWGPYPGWMGSLSFGLREEGSLVYDVDMNRVEAGLLEQEGE